jgi:hypothetical protein
MDWFHHRKPTIWTMLRLQARSTLKSMRCDNVFSPYTLKSKRYAALFTFHETFFRRWRVGDGFLLQARGFFSPYAAASSRPSRVRAWVWNCERISLFFWLEAGGRSSETSSSQRVFSCLLSLLSPAAEVASAMLSALLPRFYRVCVSGNGKKSWRDE